MKSRELVLDAAERVMAAEGFEAATVARVVEEAGVPPSSVYHYYGSKDGILLAVMERGAERFFADLPDTDQRIGRASQHLRRVILEAADALERQPDFLRLLIVSALQPPRGEDGLVNEVVGRVRELALARLRKHIALAFDDDPRSRATDRLARIALACIDGAFVASRTDAGVKLRLLLEPLAASLVAARIEMAKDR
jgi:AcrR family transcriptional regulator